MDKRSSFLGPFISYKENEVWVKRPKSEARVYPSSGLSGAPQ